MESFLSIYSLWSVPIGTFVVVLVAAFIIVTSKTEHNIKTSHIRKLDRIAFENKIVVTTLGDGIIEYRKGGKLHREDGPAYITPNGSQVWKINDVLHRKGGPAVIINDGVYITLKWYQFGRLSRFDGPAYIKKWIGESGLHHTIEEKWYKDGKLHRFDGPAVTSGLFDIVEEYWLEGVQYSKAEHAHRTR